MNSPLTVILIFGSFLLLPTSALTGAAEVVSPKAEKIIDRYFPEDSEGGLAVLVIRDGKVIHKKGYGLKNGKEPVTPDTKMGMASITKQFAAMCAAFLIEEGKLDLADKVSKHLPDLHLPVEERELLIGDLVHHTSGLANFIKSEERESIADYKKARLIERLNNLTHAEWLAKQPLRRPPGVEHEYTNSGYVLLARVIEVVAGMPFHEFQQERIFDKLGMSNTSDSTRFNGSGNMQTTLNDYEKWVRALRNESLIDTKTSKLLLSPGKLDNGERVDYGFGWRLTFDENDELIEVHHSGVGSAPSSSRNFVLRDLRNDITVVLFGRENLTLIRDVRTALAAEIREATLAD